MFCCTSARTRSEAHARVCFRGLTPNPIKFIIVFNNRALALLALSGCS
jgi:hypothetical protein